MSLQPLPSGSMLEALRASAQWTLHEMSGTRARATMVLDERHHQPFGIVHGGIYAIAVEGLASAAACAAVEDRGLVAVGTTNTTDFLRPVSRGALDVLATALFQGRTHQLWQVDITRADDGKLVARGQLRLANITPPQR
jgi:1,4-dihydroxy-2-naphthoyl-CoA hydrolase